MWVYCAQDIGCIIVFEEWMCLLNLLLIIAEVPTHVCKKQQIGNVLETVIRIEY